jgi:hypothetical protein
MLASDGAALGGPGSGSGDNDPRLMEQPQSAIESNSSAAVVGRRRAGDAADKR